MMHDLAKKIVYRHANSNAMSISRDYTPTWIWIVVALNIVLLALAALAFWFLVLGKKCKKGGKKAAENAAKTVAILLIAGLALASMNACAGAKKEELPDVVTDLKFDFESGEFSFSDVENAKNYTVRLFEAEPAEDAVDMPMAARRVRDREGYDKYEGFVDLSELHPGEKYNAVVYTYAKDSNGDLINVVSEPVTGVYKATYSTPGSAGVTPYKDGPGVTVEFGNDFFTEEYLNKSPSYLVKLLANGAEVGSVTLTANDIEVITTETENSSGGKETSTETTGVAKFPATGDSITVQLISTDSTAYYDSEASAPIQVLDAKPAQEGEGGEGQQGGEGEGGSGGEGQQGGEGGSGGN